MKTSPTRILTKSIASIAALYAITAHSAVVFKADNSDDLFNATSWSLGAVPTAGDIATWDATVTSANSELLGADLSWLGLRILNPGGAVTIGGANTLTLGTSGIDMSLASQNLTVSSNVVLGAAQSWNVGAGRTLTDDGVISGGVSLTKTGAGTLSLSGANTYTGATTITRGTELLNFAAVGAPTTNIISASSALAMNGGSLVVQGAVGGASSQAFASTAFTAGLSSITAAPGAGGTATISLGNVTAATLSLVRFGNTGTITVGSIPTGTLGILGTPFVQAAAGTIPTFGYATYGLDDFAAVSSGTIVGLASVAGYQTTYGANFDMTANTTLANGGAQRPANVVRWNTPAATTLTAGTSNLVTFTGALVTPNMGAVNAAFATGAGGVWQVNRQTSPNGAQQAAIWQNNTLGYFNVSIPIVDGREGVSDPTQVVKGGAGTVVLSGASTYTGRTSIYEGALMISADNNLGAATTPLTIAGGTLLSNATFNLATTHAITIGPGGAGGFAATTGNTLTVGSVIGGTTELVVGLGTVAGSGAGTANTTAVLGDGRVDFTAANTFSGGTVINAGSARINGINALGGANYGGLTLNGGKLEYAASLTSGSDLTIGNGVTLDAGGGTIDTNGNNVSYANALRGIGALTKSGAGSLTLNAAAAYAGGTTINGGSLKVLAPVGSATGSGGVTVNSGGTLAGAGTIAGNVAVNTGGTLEPGNGGIGTFNVPALTLGVDSLFNYEFNGTLAGDITNVGVSNGLTINGGKFNLFLEGTANPLNIPGVFNVFSYVGSILGTGPSAFSVVNPASGYNYTFGTSGNFVTLTVATSGLITEWAQPGGGTWNLGINWTNATPDVAGATVNLGSAITAPSTVTLDGSRTVGAIVFNNANAYTVAQGTGGSLNLQASTGSAGLSVNNGAHTIAVPVFLVSPLTAEISTGTSLTLSGAVSGTQVITKRGNGTLALNAANTYSSTILEAGTIELGNSAALGSGTLTVAGNGNLRFGVNSLNVANNIAIPVANTLTMDTQSFGVTVSGSISGSGSLTKTGGGTLTLAGTNTYTGVTSVTGGALSVADLQNGGVASSVGQSSSGAENLVINGASLAYTGAGSTTDRLFTIGTASAVIDASGTGPLAFSNTGALVLSGANTARTLFLDGANTGTNILTPTIGNNGTGATSLVKSGDSKWQLAGSNIFTGPTQIVGGILEIGTPLALQNSNLDYNNLGGLLAFGSVTAATFGGITGAQSLALSNNAAGAVALTVGGNNASANYSGGFTGAGGLTKVGTGVLTLGAASSYSGATFINGGAIRASVTDAIPAGSTTAINVGNGVLLGNGVTLSMPVTIATAASEFMDVPDAAAAATFGGTASTVGSTQYRLGISGAGASLTVTGMHTIPGATTIAFITRGNITFAGSGGIALNTANNTFQFGRFAGQPLNVMLKDNASITSGDIGFGGGVAGGAVTLTMENNASITARNFDFHGINSNVPVTMNMNGNSVLTAASFTKFQVTAGRETTLNLNGGTIRAGVSNANFLPALTGLTVNLGAMGGIIDTNGFDVTIGQAFSHDAALGGSSDGGLQKSGAGTLTITGFSTYDGPTVVNVGTLIVSGGITGSETVIPAGSVLGGGGFIKSATIDGILAPGLSGGAGNLTAIGAVTFGSGSAFLAEFNGLMAATEYDQLTLGTDAPLTIAGGSFALTLGFAPALGSTFTVVDNGSTFGITGAFDNLADGGTIDAGFGPDLYQFQADYSGGDGNDLVLTVVPEPGSAALLLGGLALLGVRRKRQS